MERKHIYTNELQKTAKTLNAGDTILLSGIIYTARDAAHKRMFEALDHNLPLPFDLKVHLFTMQDQHRPPQVCPLVPAVLLRRAEWINLHPAC